MYVLAPKVIEALSFFNVKGSMLLINVDPFQKLVRYILISFLLIYVFLKALALFCREYEISRSGYGIESSAAFTTLFLQYILPSSVNVPKSGPFSLRSFLC